MANTQFTKKNYTLNKNIFLPLIFTLLILFPPQLFAATYTWTGNASTGSKTDWNNKENWKIGSTTATELPKDTDDIVINTLTTSSYPEINLTSGSGKITVNSLTLKTNTTLTITEGMLEVKGDITNNGTITTSASNAVVRAAGNITDNGTITGPIALIGTAAQNFSPNTTSTPSPHEYDEIRITYNSEGEKTFSDYIKIKKLTFTTPAPPASSKTTSSDIIFSKGGNIVGDALFNTTGTVKIDASVKNFEVKGKLELGTVELNGNIESTGNQIYSKTITLKGDTNIKSTSGTLAFQELIEGTTYNLTTSGTETTFAKDINLKSIITNGEINLPEKITTTADQEYKNTVNLSGPTIFNSSAGNIILNTIAGSENLTVEKAKKITFNSNITSVTNLNLTADEIQLPSTITTTGAQTYTGLAILKGETTLTINDTTTAPATVPYIAFTPNSAKETIALQDNKLNLTAHTLIKGGQIMSGQITSSKDFIIQPTSETTITSSIKANNVIIDTSEAKVTINSNITAEDTIALLGPAYDTKDQESNVNDIYVLNYKNQTNITIPSPTKTNGTLLSINKALTMTSKNFYANGVTVDGTGKLTLSFNPNKNTIENYATAYYSDFSGATVEITGGTTDSNKLVTEACTLSNTASNKQDFSAGWDSEDFVITSAHTIDDDVIFVEFNRPIRFINDGDKNGIKTDTGTNKIQYSGPKNYNNKFYSKSSTTFEEITPTKTSGGPDSFSTIYLTAPETWNTDATGESAGFGTDKQGNKKNVIPYLDIPRNSGAFSYFITDLYGKRLLHYSEGKKYVKNHEITPPSGTPYTPNYDQCAPVLLSVSTGQENHTQSSPKSYDAHNFIEFRYSEPVYIGNKATSNTTEKSFNTKLNPTTFSEIDNLVPISSIGEITNNTSGFTVAGIATIAAGHISTGKQSAPATEDLSINTLYRKDECSLRISIAGQTTGTGNSRKWIGFINKETTIPTGEVSLPSTTYITDLNNNSLVETFDIETFDESSNPKTPTKVPITITVSNALTDSTSTVIRPKTDYTYGPWDLSAPVLAPVNYSTKWDREPQYEMLGYTSGSAKVQRLEFHMLDNTPDYSASSKHIWYSSNGWFNESETKIGPSADIYGGSRPFIDDAKGRTPGGIRFHTINKAAFKYSTSQLSNQAFGTPNKNVDSLFFKGTYTGTKNPIGELYFSLDVSSNNIPLKTKFTVSYKPEANMYITDLAGNKLLPFENCDSVDKTPPTFNIAISPINKKEIFIVFSKKLNTNMSQLNFYATKDDSDNNNPISIKGGNSFNEAISYSFNIAEEGTTSTTPLQVDHSIPAVVSTKQKSNGTEITTIKLTLNKEVTYENLLNCYIELGPAVKANGIDKIETSYDPLTGINNSQVTLIRDMENGFYMEMGARHAISDFAINLINPIYAYNPDMNNGSNNYTFGLYKDGSWAVHDWSPNQQNYGTLLAGKSAKIIINKNIPDSIKDKIKVYISNTPDPQSISIQLNKDFDSNYRIWIPDADNNPATIGYPSIAKKENTNFDVLNVAQNVKTTTASTTTPSTPPTTTPTPPAEPEILNYYFDISKDLAEKYGTNSQISFLFGIDGAKICLNPLLNQSTSAYDYTNKVPLYCLRLNDMSDITSIDMWSYKTKTTTLQRGGVSILNNVINVEEGEDALLKVQVPSDGNLSIMILTLDGNIVKYLQRGNIKSGNYDYYWDGTNDNNTKVARGMYFVRVVGAGIDETRKIMIVK